MSLEAEVVQTMTQEEVTQMVWMALIGVSGTIITIVSFIWKVWKQRAADLAAIEERVASATNRLWEKYDYLSSKIVSSDDEQNTYNAERRREMRNLLEGKLERAIAEVKELINRIDSNHKTTNSTIFTRIESLAADLRTLQHEQKQDAIRLLERLMDMDKKT